VSALYDEGLGEGGDDVLEARLEVLAQLSLLVDGREQVLLVALEVGEEVSLPLQDAADWDGVEVAVNTGEDERNHLVDGHWGVLLLLEELGQLQME